MCAGTCFEAFFPGNLDILILEHLPTLGGHHRSLSNRIEGLILRLQLHFNGSMPAIIILNMHRALEGPLAVAENEQCLRDIKLCSTEDSCRDVFSSLPEPRSIASTTEEIAHNLARYYGFASLSHTALIISLFRDDVHSRLGMSECQLFATLYADRVHPSNLGRMLMVGCLGNKCCTQLGLAWCMAHVVLMQSHATELLYLLMPHQQVTALATRL
jgi:hypothetical protein